MLFTDRSVWTMVHGIVLGGAALMGLSAALFYLYAAHVSDGPQAAAPNASRALAALTVLTAVTLWLTGTGWCSTSSSRLTVPRRLPA